MTLTNEQTQAIAKRLARMILPVGIGDKENACSIAAINLALSGRLTDEVPTCMSKVIGEWVRDAQDAMPTEMRNSAEWKTLLPLAAGTGRDNEETRLDFIIEWMFVDVLPSLQRQADAGGFGAEWLAMTEQRTVEAACAAALAADSKNARLAYRAAISASRAVSMREGTLAVNVARIVVMSLHTESDLWERFNPCGLLAKLIHLDRV